MYLVTGGEQIGCIQIQRVHLCGVDVLEQFLKHIVVQIGYGDGRLLFFDEIMLEHGSKHRGSSCENCFVDSNLFITHHQYGIAELGVFQQDLEVTKQLTAFARPFIVAKICVVIENLDL